MQRIDIMDPEVDLDEHQRYLYKGSLYTGEAVEFGPDGTMRGLWTLTRGLGDGPQRSWYADGSLESEGLSRMGKPVGEWREWHPSGQIKTLNVFDENGMLVSTTEWRVDGTKLESPGNQTR